MTPYRKFQAPPETSHFEPRRRLTSAFSTSSGSCSCLVTSRDSDLEKREQRAAKGYNEIEVRFHNITRTRHHLG